MGLAVVGFGGFDLVVEGAEVDRLALIADGRDPLTGPLEKVDALEPRGPTAVRDAVAGVLFLRADAQVATAVVETVVVDVVDHGPLGRVHDESVHELELVAGAASGVEAATLVAVGEPSVPAEPLVVGSVNDGELAACQRNVADLTVRRRRRFEPDNRAALRTEIGTGTLRLDANESAGRIRRVGADQQRTRAVAERARVDAIGTLSRQAAFCGHERNLAPRTHFATPNRPTATSPTHQSQTPTQAPPQKERVA